MRIVTYNVNGLRARLVPPRTLLSFLNSLAADVICFQETKLSRQELTADIAVAEGYESFFSCTRTVKKGRVGYSGVATFCRIGAAVPVAADEGFTGFLHGSQTGEIEAGKGRVGCYEEVWNMENITRQELLQLDSEGRCLVTDHSSFVLFNFYGPHVECGDEERFLFKSNFYRALQHRWEGLLKRGRRVIAVGDYNICPFPIDSCDPGPEFDSSPMRQWLRSMLQSGGGPFLDTFRVIHPDRKEAYTCWSQASGAEEFNYGARIDLILAAGTCVHQGQANNSSLPSEDKVEHSFGSCEVEDCDILEEFKRFKSDSVPRCLGRSEKLEGSDHAPVFVKLKKQPPLEPHDVPPLAARFMPELRGRQQSIVSLLQKRPHSSQITTEPDPNLKVKVAKSELPHSAATMFKRGGSKTIKKLEPQKGRQQNLRSFFVPTLPNLKNNIGNVSAVQSCSQDPSYKTLVQNSVADAPLEHLLSSKDGEEQLMGRGCEASEGCSSVATAHPSKLSSMELLQQIGSQDISKILVEVTSCPWKPEAETSSLVEFSEKLFLERETLQSSQKSTASLEWRRIQKVMAQKVPLCKGHKEPCVARVVKKEGPNFGRAFHVCARAQGPSSNPEAKCNHFEWNASFRVPTKK